MWQVLIAAAVAGSTGLVAKHFLSPNTDTPDKQKENPEKTEEKPQGAGTELEFHFPLISDASGEKQGNNIDGIFRFSSSGGRSSSSSSFSSSREKKVRNSPRNLGITCRRLSYAKENGDHDEQVASGGGRRRTTVFLKKRRIIRTAPSKCFLSSSSSSSAKDGSLFGWGLGVGMMCMMSAGKAEISKMSAAMDETSKVVNELRTELYKRKSAQVAAGFKETSAGHYQTIGDGSNRTDGSTGNVKIGSLPMSDDFECPSSVLTEEPKPEVLEMDQLEAELEFELLKLPWSNNEASGDESVTEAMSSKCIGPQKEVAVSYQCQGVSPSELDQKLCHLLIEKQETQIVELESELHLAQSKLHEKEAELQALKDCVKCLTEFSLSNASDNETHGQEEQEFCSGWDNNGEMGSELRRSLVGMKRPISLA